METIRGGSFLRLEVREVPFNDWWDISEIIKEWKRAAVQKIVQISDKSSEVFQRFIDIADFLQEEITPSYGQKESDNGLFVAYDQDSIVQGVAFFSKKRCYLEYLISNPENLQHSINVKRVHGAGTSIIHHLARIAEGQNQPLLVKPAPASVSFYTQFDFEKNGSVGAEMCLSVEKIRKLISKSIIKV